MGLEGLPTRDGGKMIVAKTGNEVAPTFTWTGRQMSHDWCSTQTFSVDYRQPLTTFFSKWAKY